GAVLRERRSAPQEDLISIALTFEFDGAPVAESDLLDLCTLLFIAGLGSVAAQLAYAFLHLATHDSDRVWIVREPHVVHDAVEEILRVYPLVPLMRRVTRDVEFHGCSLAAGDFVMLSLFCANRDDRWFADPERVDFDRHDNHHLGFGGGPHRCLGSHLARR